MLKKCLKEEGVQLQDTELTDEREEEGGGRHLSLERSVSSIERRREIGEGSERQASRGMGDGSQPSKGIGLPACSRNGGVAGSGNPDH